MQSIGEMKRWGDEEVRENPMGDEEAKGGKNPWEMKKLREMKRQGGKIHGR
jgi:hypothetical protein